VYCFLAVCAGWKFTELRNVTTNWIRPDSFELPTQWKIEMEIGTWNVKTLCMACSLQSVSYIKREYRGSDGKMVALNGQTIICGDDIHHSGTGLNVYLYLRVQSLVVCLLNAFACKTSLV
jgi:hypothetical protein